MATRRSSSTVTAAGPAARPGRTASAIACGSSDRGLSEVSTTTSAPSPTAAPISGRLAGSRSPPQPKTHDHPAAGAGEGAGGGEHAAEGVGRVGVVDEHGEGLAGVDPLEAARVRPAGCASPSATAASGEAGGPRVVAAASALATLNGPTRGRCERGALAHRDGRRAWTRCRPVRTTAPRRSRRRSRRRRRRSRASRSVARARAASSTPRGSSRFTAADGARRGSNSAPWPRSTRPASRGSRGGRD